MNFDGPLAASLTGRGFFMRELCEMRRPALAQEAAFSQRCENDTRIDRLSVCASMARVPSGSAPHRIRAARVVRRYGITAKTPSRLRRERAQAERRAVPHRLVDRADDRHLVMLKNCATDSVSLR